MKRPRSPSAVPADPVLAQLDALINGPPPTDAPVARPASPPPATLPAVNPVLAQLDALINPSGSAGASATATAPPPVHFATPVALVLPSPPPPLAPPPIVAAPEEPLLPLSSPAWRHAGVLREYGGVHAWMRLLSLERGGEP